MPINISSNFDSFADDLTKQVQTAAEDELVTSLVETARENGLTNVDDIELNIEGEGASFRIDRARVRRIANQKLSGLGGSL